MAKFDNQGGPLGGMEGYSTISIRDVPSGCLTTRGKHINNKTKGVECAKGTRKVGRVNRGVDRWNRTVRMRE